jgi:DNA-binding XRE family transcriptional regulator
MIGMSIRVLRKRNKMSQEILAERVNVSRQTVAKWENEEAL